MIHGARGEAVDSRDGLGEHPFAAIGEGKADVVEDPIEV